MGNIYTQTMSISNMLHNNRYPIPNRNIALRTFMLLAVASLVSSCNNNKASQGLFGAEVANVVSLFKSGDSIDVPLYLNVERPFEEFYDNDTAVDSNYDGFSRWDGSVGFKAVAEDENTIRIDADYRYYNLYTSQRRFKVPQMVWFEYPYAESLNLQIDVVNIKSFPLDIEDLIVVVERSEPDTVPFVYICTEEVNSDAISFYNGSWFNWGGFTFNYSILKKGERFNGKYKSTRHIDYFERDSVINLIPELIGMGYDFKRICQQESKLAGVPFDANAFKKVCEPGFDFCIPDSVEDKDATFWNNVREYKDILLCGISSLLKSKGEAAKREAANLFYPFETDFGQDDTSDQSNEKDEYSWELELGSMTAYATLYGNIIFDNTNYSVDFIARVSLKGTCGRGAGGWENDKFDIMLHRNDSNYQLRLPYTTVIVPNATEMVKLAVKAPISSNHKMYIFLNNGNNLNIRSKDILLHYLLPPKNE